MSKAKGKTTNNTDDGTTDKDSGPKANPGFTGHHRAMIQTGHTLVMESRPRGRPYRIEEWLGPDRFYTLVKATDGGQLTRYVEQQNSDDATELMRGK